MTRLLRRAVLSGIAASVSVLPVLPRGARAETLFLDGLGVAIMGYDPVAFFDIQQARKGVPEYELKTDEGLWWFTSAANRDAFARDPKRYMPQFGGFCAQGLALGFKRRSDPTLWVLIDGKLYMHYSVPDQNRWAEDIRGNIRLAEENWPELKDM